METMVLEVTLPKALYSRLGFSRGEAGLRGLELFKALKDTQDYGSASPR